MIDEKTKQPQQAPAPRQAPRRGEKMRSLWAQLQCTSLLQRHRLRRGAQNVAEKLFLLLRENALTSRLGELLYTLGFATEYVFVCTGRAVRYGALTALSWCRKALQDTLRIAFPGAAQVFRDLFGPLVLAVRGTARLLVRANRIHREKNFSAACKASAEYIIKGVENNLSLLPRMVSYLLPLGAAVLFVTVVRSTVSRPYVLGVQVDGETVGYVANEETFNSAREAVQTRINYAGTDKTDWTVEPSYTVAVSDETMDENEMANAILRTASDEISEGTALYLDDELVAVCSDGESLRAYLDSMLDPYEDPDDPDMKVGFNKAVTLENGIYFNESFQDEKDVEEMLVSVQSAQKVYTVQTGDSLSLIASKNGLTLKELLALNADIGLTLDYAIFPGDELTITKEESLLEVWLTKTVSWEEEIPYATETTRSADYTVGTRKTLQEGVPGVRLVTAENVYDTDGMLLEQTILRTETLQEPVTQKVVVGTKKITTSTTQITGNGQFIWPVPQYRYCSRWYGGSHRGVDICAPAGTPIYASAGGTIYKAGYERAGAGTNYGYSVIINHSGGYQTVYAHCLSLVVHAGQTVKQGQLIGYVGSTGRSSGNHCHFEIRRNGSYLAPQNFFNRSQYR